MYKTQLQPKATQSLGGHKGILAQQGKCFNGEVANNTWTHSFISLSMEFCIPKAPTCQIQEELLLRCVAVPQSLRTSSNVRTLR